jgi:hypothetical protein
MWRQSRVGNESANPLKSRTRALVCLRSLSGAAGLIAVLVAIAGSWNFVLIQIEEVQSARQYGGQVSFWGAVGGTATVLFFVLFLGLAAYFLLRFSFKAPTATRR